MGLFSPRRYACTAKELEMLVQIGQIKGYIESLERENERLSKENAELRGHLLPPTPEATGRDE
jgi:regulator of replication initiation timing